jgi:subtilisin family serine protease
MFFVKRFLLALLVLSTPLVAVAGESEGVTVAVSGDYSSLKGFCSEVFSYGKTTVMECDSKAFSRVVVRRVSGSVGNQKFYSYYARKRVKGKPVFTAFEDRVYYRQQVEEKPALQSVLFSNYRFLTGAARVETELGIKGEGIVVAVLDSEVDCTHPDLKSNCVREKESVVAPQKKYDNHGTEMAGIVASTSSNMLFRGIAPGAVIHSITIVAGNGGTNGGAVAAGIRKAADDPSVRVISLSVSMKSMLSFLMEGDDCDGYAGLNWFYRDLPEAVKYAADKEKVLVVSGLNERGLSGLPGCLSRVTVVASVDSNKDKAKDSSTGASMRNHGLSAPGVRIGVLQGNLLDLEKYSIIGYSGDSYAAPMVSGTIALMLEANPGLSPKEIREILFKTADKSRNKNAKPDEEYGNGILDAYAAVSEAKIKSKK